MKRVSLNLDDDTYHQFRLATFLNGVTMMEAMRDAVYEYLADTRKEGEK